MTRPVDLDDIAALVDEHGVSVVLDEVSSCLSTMEYESKAESLVELIDMLDDLIVKMRRFEASVKK